MKKTLIGITLIIGLLQPAFSRGELVDGIAAQVGNDIVLLSEVMQSIYTVEEKMRSQGVHPSMIAELRADALEQLIERKLIDQVVRRSELQASDTEVDYAIENIAKDNGITLEELQESVELQGMSFAFYRERIRTEIEHTKVLNGAVFSQVRIDESELKALYQERYGNQPQGGESYHLLHFLIPVEPKKRSLAQSCQEVKKARAKIQTAKDFHQMASELSVVNPEKGGDIGWVHQDSLASWMNQVVQSMEPGQTSDAVKQPFGCNLLHLVARESYQPVSLDDVRDELFQELTSQQREEKYREWIDKLRAQTYIERRGYFADAARLIHAEDEAFQEAPLESGIQ